MLRANHGSIANRLYQIYNSASQELRALYENVEDIARGAVKRQAAYAFDGKEAQHRKSRRATRIELKKYES